MAQPGELRVGNETYSIYRLDTLQSQWDVARLPYTLRILLENVLRNGSEAEVEAVAGWVAAVEPSSMTSVSTELMPSSFFGMSRRVCAIVASSLKAGI